jgi:hypothetical protein
MVGQRMKPQENVSFRLKNIMLGAKKLQEEHLFPLEKLFFLPTVEKNNRFSSGNKSSHQSFSVPGIMFPARRNIYSGWGQCLQSFCRGTSVHRSYQKWRSVPIPKNYILCEKKILLKFRCSEKATKN